MFQDMGRSGGVLRRGGKGKAKQVFRVVVQDMENLGAAFYMPGPNALGVQFRENREEGRILLIDDEDVIV